MKLLTSKISVSLEILARLGNWTFPKNGKQRACKIPKIYGAVGKMLMTSYVRYSAQYVCKTDYTGHRTYGASHNTNECQTDYTVRVDII